jgi:hypothetical protein
MSLFSDKYKRRAAIGTFLVHLVLVFVFYSFGLKYMDPKIEEGIAIEFGYVEEGMGEEITQTEEIKTEVVEQVQNLEEVSPEVNTDISEDVFTQDVDDAPVITEEEQKEQVQDQSSIEQEEKKAEASDELQQALSSLFQSTENTQSGDSDQTGAQGDETGSVEGAEEAIGGEGNSADGYELGDRKAIRKPRPNYSCNETGVVVIRVWVNAEGITYKAELDLKNTTDTSPCLVREAKAAALKTTWLADANAEPIQIGSIIYNFRKL